MSVVTKQEVEMSTHEDELDDLRQQFVTFFVGAQCMAFDMSRVMEIVRVPETVEVPLTPCSLLGLANLRGTILPVLSLRRVLGLEDTDNTDATRVMVLNYFGRPLGFVVDKVTRVIGVQPEAIEGINAQSSTFDSHLLSGVLKNVDEQALIQLIDIDALTQQEYSNFTAVNEGNAAATHQNNTLVQHAEDNDEQDIRQLVSFSVADQEYSFDITATQEIIRLPETINSVPQAPPHVMGMVNLRNRVLPLMRLSTMFGLPQTELSEVNRIVVLTLAREGALNMVGVIVDEVREVLRIHRNQVEDVPALLMDGRDMQELEGICQLDKGKRIVTLLSAEKLFKRNDILEAVNSVENQLPEDDESVSGGHAEAASEREGEDDMNAAETYQEDHEPQLVVFNLVDQEYGVMIESVREILRLPDNLTQVPKTSDFVEGMINLRGAVLPIIDMRTRFGLPRLEQNDRQRIIVLNQDQVLTGYIVDSVSEVMRLQANQIEAAPDLSEEQRKVMGRIVNLRNKKRIITVLEPEQLLSTEEQQQLMAESNESTRS